MNDHLSQTEMDLLQEIFMQPSVAFKDFQENETVAPCSGNCNGECRGIV